MRTLASAARLLGWGVVAVLGVLAVGRVAAWDAQVPTLVGVHGLGPLPYLAAVPVAVLALVAGRKRLAAVALAVAAAILPTGLPEYAAAAGEPPGARTSPGFSILSWNLYVGNADAAAIDRVVSGANADVVVLQEVSDANRAALEASTALAGYRHRFSSPAPSAFGSGIWSRLPLEGAEEVDVGGLPMTRATLRTAAGPVRLVNVHVLSPVAEDGRDLWPRQLRALGEEARRPGPPILLAGDFNATWGHRPFRRLLDAGLEDAAAARAARWAPTWPEGRRLPPLLRIDHVLTGRGLTPTSYRTGPAGGSDHRPVVVGVAVQPSRV